MFGACNRTGHSHRKSKKDEKEQAITAQARSPKELLILDCALKLLIETGDAGLTLRKLAETAGMRLSNVQYYFSSRDEVLAAMVSRYFDECAASLLALTQQSEAATAKERVHFLVRTGLSHGQEISDMCRAFREIWAISSRNAVIDQCLMDYYRNFSDIMADYAFPDGLDAEVRARIQTLLIPFVEGYSITARALPLDMEQTAEMLTDLTLSIVDR